MEELGPTARILIVEDEGLQRLWLADVLEREGFEVLEAATGDAALHTLEHAATCDPPVRAVISDVQMPGTITGVELARRVLERWPHIEVVILSGYASAEQEIPNEVRLLRKPVHEDLLIAVVHHITRYPS